jgi:poly-gamma-glutamate synthesis protein (capsule biosynthesis protein)
VVSDRKLESIALKNDRIISSPVSLEGLRKAGISHLSLANNHVYDFGREGLEDTLYHLESRHFTFFGAGRNRAEANALKTIHYKGKTIGVLSRTFTCEAAHAGIGAEQPQAAELVRSALLNTLAAASHDYSLMIIILHFGFEYCFYPNAEDVLFCRSLIDAGADLVIGHHPHVFQGIEKYKDGLIAYSLGNFIFDTTDEHIPDTSRGIMLQVKLEETGDRLKLADYRVTPTAIQHSGEVTLPDEKTKEEILEQLSGRSSALNLSEHEYRLFSDKSNAKTVMDVRKKEIIKYLKKGNILYLLKKSTHIRWVHLRLMVRHILRFVPRKLSRSTTG